MITDEQRFALTSIFDTDPKKKKMYADRLGIVLDKDDPNKYYIKGKESDGYYFVDPENFSLKKGFSYSGLHELGMDVKEAGESVLSTIPTAIGGAGGAALGLMGGPMTSLFTGIAGGTIGAAATRKVKSDIQDIYLDKKVPVEYAPLITNSLVEGTYNALLPGGAAGAKNLSKEGLQKAWEYSRKKTLSTIEKVMPKFGWSPELVKDVIANTDKYKDAVLDTALEQSRKLHAKIFGGKLDPSTQRFTPGSAFDEHMQPLYAKQKEQLKLLDASKDAGMTMQELRDVTNNFIKELSTSGDGTLKPIAKGSDLDNTIKILNGHLSAMEKAAADTIKKQGVAPRPDLINNFQFKHSYVKNNFLDEVRADAFGKGTKIPDFKGSSNLRQFVGAQTLGDDIATSNDLVNKAVSPKSTLANALELKQRNTYNRLANQGVLIEPENQIQNVNKEMNKVFKVAEKAEEILSPDAKTAATKMVQNYSGVKSESKLDAQEAMNMIDSALGTNYSAQAKDIALQREYGMIKDSMSQPGSKNYLAEVEKQASAYGKKGMAMGSGMGMLKAGPVGGAVGGGIGYLGGRQYGKSQATKYLDPENVIAMIDKANKQSKLPGQVIDTVSDFVANKYAAPVIAKQMSTPIDGVEAPDMVSSAEAMPIEEKKPFSLFDEEIAPSAPSGVKKFNLFDE